MPAAQSFANQSKSFLNFNKVSPVAGRYPGHVTDAKQGDGSGLGPGKRPNGRGGVSNIGQSQGNSGALSGDMARKAVGGPWGSRAGGYGGDSPSGAGSSQGLESSYASSRAPGAGGSGAARPMPGYGMTRDQEDVARANADYAMTRPGSGTGGSMDWLNKYGPDSDDPKWTEKQRRRKERMLKEANDAHRKGDARGTRAVEAIKEQRMRDKTYEIMKGDIGKDKASDLGIPGMRAMQTPDGGMAYGRTGASDELKAYAKENNSMAKWDAMTPEQQASASPKVRNLIGLLKKDAMQGAAIAEAEAKTEHQRPQAIVDKSSPAPGGTRARGKNGILETGSPPQAKSNYDENGKMIGVPGSKGQLGANWQRERHDRMEDENAAAVNNRRGLTVAVLKGMGQDHVQREYEAGQRPEQIYRDQLDKKYEKQFAKQKKQWAKGKPDRDFAAAERKWKEDTDYDLKHGIQPGPRPKREEFGRRGNRRGEGGGRQRQPKQEQQESSKNYMRNLAQREPKLLPKVAQAGKGNRALKDEILAEAKPRKKPTAPLQPTPANTAQVPNPSQASAAPKKPQGYGNRGGRNRNTPPVKLQTQGYAQQKTGGFGNRGGRNRRQPGTMKNPNSRIAATAPPPKATKSVVLAHGPSR